MRKLISLAAAAMVAMTSVSAFAADQDDGWLASVFTRKYAEDRSNAAAPHFRPDLWDTGGDVILRYASPGNKPAYTDPLAHLPPLIHVPYGIRYEGDVTMPVPAGHSVQLGIRGTPSATAMPIVCKDSIDADDVNILRASVNIKTPQVPGELTTGNLLKPGDNSATAWITDPTSPVGGQPFVSTGAANHVVWTNTCWIGDDYFLNHPEWDQELNAWYGYAPSSPLFTPQLAATPTADGVNPNVEAWLGTRVQLLYKDVTANGPWTPLPDNAVKHDKDALHKSALSAVGSSPLVAKGYALGWSIEADEATPGRTPTALLSDQSEVVAGDGKHIVFPASQTTGSGAMAKGSWNSMAPGVLGIGSKDKKYVFHAQSIMGQPRVGTWVFALLLEGSDATKNVLARDHYATCAAKATIGGRPIFGSNGAVELVSGTGIGALVGSIAFSDETVGKPVDIKVTCDGQLGANGITFRWTERGPGEDKLHSPRPGDYFLPMPGTK
jgi:hypothetical protein